MFLRNEPTDFGGIFWAQCFFRRDVYDGNVRREFRWVRFRKRTQIYAGKWGLKAHILL